MNKPKVIAIVILIFSTFVIGNVLISNALWPPTPPPHGVTESVSSYQSKMPQTEYFNGSNSTVILNNTVLSSDEAVFYNGQRLRTTVDYTVTHNSTNSNITLNIPIFDTDYVIVDYHLNQLVNLTISLDDFNGAAILPSKNITLTNTGLSSYERVYLNGQRLRTTVDYTVQHLTSSSWVQLYNPIIDSDYIMIEYYEE